MPLQKTFTYIYIDQLASYKIGTGGCFPEGKAAGE
jgi:hypothetical protein